MNAAIIPSHITIDLSHEHVYTRATANEAYKKQLSKSKDSQKTLQVIRRRKKHRHQRAAKAATPDCEASTKPLPAFKLCGKSFELDEDDRTSLSELAASLLSLKSSPQPARSSFSLDGRRRKTFLPTS